MEQTGVVRNVVAVFTQWHVKDRPDDEIDANPPFLCKQTTSTDRGPRQIDGVNPEACFRQIDRVPTDPASQIDCASGLEATLLYTRVREKERISTTSDVALQEVECIGEETVRGRNLAASSTAIAAGTIANLPDGKDPHCLTRSNSRKQSFEFRYDRNQVKRFTGCTQEPRSNCRTGFRVSPS